MLTPEEESLESKVIKSVIELGGEVLIKFHGEVVEIDLSYNPGAVLVKFDEEGTFSRFFPKEQLEACGACCVGAEIIYTVYKLGPLRVSSIENVTPSTEELLKEDWLGVSEEDLKRLGS